MMKSDFVFGQHESFFKRCSANSLEKQFYGNEGKLTGSLVKKVLQFPSHTRQLRQFLLEFTSEKNGIQEHSYVLQLRIVNRESSVLHLYLDDLNQFHQNKEDANGCNHNESDNPNKFKTNDKEGFISAFHIQENCLRYKKLLYEACESILQTLQPSNTNDASLVFSTRTSEEKQKMMERANVPIHLRVPYEICIVPLNTMKSLSVRDVRATHIGRLVKMEGVITKVSSVKPRLQVACYKCTDCGSHVYQPIDNASFMPLVHCESQACQLNQKKGELHMILPESIFVKYQQVKIQEPPHMVPAGSVPRSQNVIIEGSLTRQVLPGLNVLLSGILMPVVKSMFHEILYSGVSTETVFHVQQITIIKKGYELQQEDIKLYKNITMEDKLAHYQRDPDLYERLAFSIAPSIHGLVDVKKVLILQLIGGVTEEFSDGMRLRGDIHVLLLGDPGVAKSQLLGQIAHIAPRAHYTTGKGSSGVGLTASVVRDPTTGDFTLEGGAIVLSDRGICCIDEFDKMDEYDRTAIHEVMEQQTVSISKAGLTTTLNARTSILAAANPQYGRYDITKSPMKNMNIPAALLSRFDVQFLLLDQVDYDNDLRLARHVLKVHQTSSQNEQFPKKFESFDAETIRAIIGRARTYNPQIPRSLINEIVEYYVELRQRERAERSRNEFNSYTTPRTLFAILRLSQALARLRFTNLVDRGDFEEALRLVMESKRSVMQAQIKHTQHTRREDFQSEIMSLLKDLDAKMARRDSWDGWFVRRDVEELVTRQGFSVEQLLRTIDVYNELYVLEWESEAKTKFGFSERIADYSA